jgi:hypothetical protein
VGDHAAIIALLLCAMARAKYYLLTSDFLEMLTFMHEDVREEARALGEKRAPASPRRAGARRSDPRATSSRSPASTPQSGAIGSSGATIGRFARSRGGVTCAASTAYRFLLAVAGLAS